MRSASQAGSRFLALSSLRYLDVTLGLYALAAGSLATSAGVLISQLNSQGSVVTTAISLIVAASITILAGFSADPVLSWLLPSYRNHDSSADA